MTIDEFAKKEAELEQKTDTSLTPISSSKLVEDKQEQDKQAPFMDMLQNNEIGEWKLFKYGVMTGTSLDIGGLNGEIEKRYLLVVTCWFGSIVNANITLRINGDTGNNYSIIRHSTGYHSSLDINAVSNTAATDSARLNDDTYGCLYHHTRTEININPGSILKAFVKSNTFSVWEAAQRVHSFLDTLWTAGATTTVVSKLTLIAASAPTKCYYWLYKLNKP